jgi:hypothetical protein
MYSAKQMGKLAKAIGQPKDQNPYDPDTHIAEYIRWNIGWMFPAKKKKSKMVSPMHIGEVARINVEPKDNSCERM